MELRKSYLTRSYQQELRPRAKIFFLKGGWEGSGPNSNFSKLLELSETSRARKLIFELLVNIDKGNSSRGRAVSQAYTIIMEPTSSGMSPQSCSSLLTAQNVFRITAKRHGKPDILTSAYLDKNQCVKCEYTVTVAR